MKDDEVTWVPTKSKYYIFTWYFGKYKNKISHSENYIPELEIQSGFNKFYGFCKTVGQISIDYTFNFDFEYICTREDPRIDKTMNFTSESEDEVIREAV